MASQASIDLAQEMYVAYYGRPADPAGLDFWAERFDATDDLTEQLDAFGSSDEFQNGFGDLTDEELVNNLYLQMFNHVADDEGLAFYLERLESGAATLADIAKQIADGSVGDDRASLDNKTEVSNTFTDEVDATGADYNEAHISGAQALIADVDETQESVDEGNQNAVDAVGLLGGTIVLNEDTPEADFSASANGLTILLSGDDQETEFDVRGSEFDDTFQIEEYFRADLNGGAGNDTVDFSDAEGDYTISLGTGTFSSDTEGNGLPDLSGTLSNIEIVFGSEQDDVINGGDADETLSGGEGVDVLRGGAGNDTFLYEDERDLGTEIVDGQTGTDVLDLSGAEVDLTAIDPDNISVETLSLSNGEGETTVMLTLSDTVPTASTGPESFDLIVGSSVQDTLVLDGAADLSGTELNGIEVVTTDVGLDVDDDSLDDVVTLVNTAGGETITAAGGTGTYDFSGTSFTGWTDIDGGAGTTETLVLNQTQIDALLDEDAGLTVFGANLTDLVAATATAAERRDTLEASGSLDLTRVAALDIRSIDFGTATSIEIDEAQLGDAVTHFVGESGTLIINETGGTLDLNEIKIDGIEILDIDSSGSVALTITGGATGAGLANVTTITGVTGSLDLTIGDGGEVDLSGTDLSQFDDIQFAAVTGDLIVDNVTLASFDEWGLGATTSVTFQLGGTSLNLTDVEYAALMPLLIVTGSSGDDIVTAGDGDALVDDRIFTYNLGAGDDTFNGVDKTNDTGAITVNGGDGDDEINLGELALAAVNGSNTATGGDGDDTLVAADASDDLTGGDGIDTFSIAMNELGVTINDFGVLGTTVTTGNDILMLNVDVGTALSSTAFSDVMNGNKLPVLTAALTTGLVSSSGNINDIAPNKAIGTSSSGLTTLASTGAAISYLAALTNYAAELGDEEFVLFATSGSSLVAFVITTGGATSVVATTEISMVTGIVALGAAGALSEADLILI